MAAPNRLAYVGYFTGPDGAQALIEEVVLRRATYKKAGEEAFGYKVRKVEKEKVVLERDGKQVELILGKNKDAAPSVPGVNSKNYRPTYTYTPGSGAGPMPYPPPPESQVIHPIRPEQIPADVKARLDQRMRQRMQEKSRNRR